MTTYELVIMTYKLYSFRTYWRAVLYGFIPESLFIGNPINTHKGMMILEHHELQPDLFGRN